RHAPRWPDRQLRRADRRAAGWRKGRSGPRRSRRSAWSRDDLLLTLLASGSDERCVGRCLRDVCRTPLREALAEVREDLAEQVELLEHGLERQACVVDEEELALVVADVVAERQRALQHLLRRAD